ncbi:MAG: hypothetical protein WKF94_19560 [Solirubrobacteraceae bacterium]
MRLLVLALILAGFVAESAQACSCAEPGDPREELAEADVPPAAPADVGAGLTRRER